ncbi:MAG: contractile injection system tape measure protein, partial [Bacteroidota bacterium]
MPDTHSIDKQKIEVSSASGVDISEVNKGLFTLRDRLDKIIDQIFNDFFPADRIVEIERITINLGTIPPTNFDQVFLNRFTEIL